MTVAGPTWFERFDAAANATLGPSSAAPPELSSFTDEAGHRREVDGPLIAWAAKLPAGPAPYVTEPDVRLWWALHDRTIDVDGIVRVLSDGPLLAEKLENLRTIEVFTEAELSAMHALWNLARERARPDWRRRTLAAAAWFMEHMQPDNATNHPWAAHVFAIGAREGLGSEAELYAQTLLHNAVVGLGRPDRFSAWILRDAAAACRAEGV